MRDFQLIRYVWSHVIEIYPKCEQTGSENISRRGLKYLSGCASDIDSQRRVLIISIVIN